MLRRMIGAISLLMVDTVSYPSPSVGMTNGGLGKSNKNLKRARGNVLDFSAKTTKSEISGVGLIQNRRENLKKRKSIFGSSRWWDAAFYVQEQSVETFAIGLVTWCCFSCMCMSSSEKGQIVLKASNNLLNENRQKTVFGYSLTSNPQLAGGTRPVPGTSTVPVPPGAVYPPRVPAQHGE